jgi:hypothetical protein
MEQIMERVIRMLRREFELMETPQGNMNMSWKRFEDIAKKLRRMRIKEICL